MYLNGTGAWEVVREEFFFLIMFTYYENDKAASKKVTNKH